MSASDPKTSSQRSERMTFAAQELRLISTLVMLIGLGLFFALPFVLSIGSVVFLPLTAAIILTIILSPLADRLSKWGLPNVLASLAALLIFFAVIILSLALILQPAIALWDQLPTLYENVASRFGELRDQFGWIAQLNAEIAEIMQRSGSQQVVLATPSLLEELAFATPSVLLEIVLTFLMAFFMIEARVRLRQRLLMGRSTFGASIKAAKALREIQDRVASYILTVGFINICVGVVVALGAWILGVDAPIMWGGLAALLNFIPYIGPTLMITLLAVFGIGTTETLLLGLIPAAAYLALNTIEANIVTPAVLGARFTVNPVMILITLSYFSWIWGITGALLSVPILLTLTALFDHIGRPNIIGFVFGEPLFANNLLALGFDEDGRKPST
ncbi:AI-2E family transporter [Erythrobacter sp. W53]|uniref:AI-2E family transporter n=1 Tax=Erythrobacter sp. W53 TaxID=3425947 RepID=UPI003D76722E